jgi:diaminopimelate epimerase
MPKQEKTMKIPFTKMQGLGNDFVIIDAITNKFIPTSENIQRLADRHYGVGCDQVLLVEKPKDASADFFYRIFNADGQEVGQCGNGARCLAKFITAQKLTNKKQIIVETIGGRLELRLENDGDVNVNMGVPLFNPKEIPFITSETTASPYNLELISNKKTKSAAWDINLPTCIKIGVVNIGNPHAVMLVDNVETVPLHLLGPLVTKHPKFPQGVNLEIIQIVSRNSLRARIYERGSAETLASGSGACAAAIIGRAWKLLDQKVTVTMKGGILAVDWPGPSEVVWMKGPAKEVFTGCWIS